VVREHVFPEARRYGRVSARPDRPAMVLDANLTSDLLLWICYDGVRPRVEIIARPGTEWNALPGQLPHPPASPDGGHIFFNNARGARTDVAVVEV